MCATSRCRHTPLSEPFEPSSWALTVLIDVLVVARGVGIKQFMMYISIDNDLCQSLTMLGQKPQIK